MHLQPKFISLCRSEKMNTGGANTFSRPAFCQYRPIVCANYEQLAAMLQRFSFACGWLEKSIANIGRFLESSLAENLHSPRKAPSANRLDRHLYSAIRLSQIETLNEGAQRASQS